MLYVALTSSIGRPRTGPTGAALAGFEEGGVGKGEGDGLDVVGGGVVGSVVVAGLSPPAWLLLLFWLVSPLSAPAGIASGASPALAWEQQLPMVEGREEEQKSENDLKERESNKDIG